MSDTTKARRKSLKEASAVSQLKIANQKYNEALANWIKVCLVPSLMEAMTEADEELIEWKMVPDSAEIFRDCVDVAYTIKTVFRNFWNETADGPSKLFEKLHKMLDRRGGDNFEATYLNYGKAVLAHVETIETNIKTVQDANFNSGKVLTVKKQIDAACSGIINVSRSKINSTSLIRLVPVINCFLKLCGFATEKTVAYSNAMDRQYKDVEVKWEDLNSEEYDARLAQLDSMWSQKMQTMSAAPLLARFINATTSVDMVSDDALRKQLLTALSMDDTTIAAVKVLNLKTNIDQVIRAGESGGMESGLLETYKAMSAGLAKVLTNTPAAANLTIQQYMNDPNMPKL